MKRCIFCEKRLWWWQEINVSDDGHIECHIRNLKEYIFQDLNTVDSLMEFQKELTLLVDLYPQYRQLWQSLMEKAQLINLDIKMRLISLKR